MNLQEIIIEATIPYIIDVFADYLANRIPNYFPVFICIVLLLISIAAKKFIPFCNDYSEKNRIHLDDIKEIIEEIDKMEENY